MEDAKQKGVAPFIHSTPGPKLVAGRRGNIESYNRDYPYNICKFEFVGGYTASCSTIPPDEVADTSTPVYSEFHGVEIDTNVVGAFNVWLTRGRFYEEEEGTTKKWDGGRLVFRSSWRAKEKTGAIIRAHGFGGTKKEAFMRMAQCVLYCTNKVARTEADNSKESEQGIIDQESSRAGNTIITRDTGEMAMTLPPQISLIDHASSEPFMEVPMITDRWFPMDNIKFDTSVKQGEVIVSYKLPQSIFKNTNLVNLLPFQSFIYSEIDFEMKFVVNAMKFQVGKIIVSYKHDPYGTSDFYDSLQSALCRPHVILDLGANNEATIKIPFHHHRALMRNTKGGDKQKVVNASYAAQVQLLCLSPMAVAAGTSTTANIRPFLRITKGRFAGMSYRATVEMDIVGDAALRLALNEVEKYIDTRGQPSNTDKPSKWDVIPIIPRTRLNFGTGKGPTDVSILKNDPTTLTPYDGIRPLATTPRTTYDIARQWGLYAAFTWSTSDEPNKVIFHTHVDPTYRYKKDSKKLEMVTPLEYVVSMYQFWSGTIEVRLDFTSNMFQSGAIQIVSEFGRSTESESLAIIDASSAYTKVFHLGEQRTVNYTVPFIYDTVMRRSAAPYFTTHTDAKSASLLGKTAASDVLSISPMTNTHMTVRVVNPLVTVPQGTPDVQVLMFIRAGEDFRMHSLKQSYLWSTRPHIPYPTQFPGTFDKTKVEMDMGQVETKDATGDFRAGRDNLRIITRDNQMSIKDIMRRPVLLYKSIGVPADKEAKVEADKIINTHSLNHFFIPVMVPSIGTTSLSEQPTLVPSISRTPQAMLSSCFRFWRGSTRFTFECQQRDALIHVGYIPHTGIRIAGIKQLPLGIADEVVTVYGWLQNTHMYVPQHSTFLESSGGSVEIWDTSINRTLQIEVPFDCENSWCNVMDCVPNDDTMKWRDKGDYNAGHVWLRNISGTTANVSVWWSAGDDFEFSNYYGIPSMNKVDKDHIYDDQPLSNKPKAGSSQGDSSNLFTQVEPRAKRDTNIARFEGDIYHDCPQDFQCEDKPTFGQAIYNRIIPLKYFVPYIGTGFLMSNAGAKLDTLTEDVKETLENVDTTILEVKEKTLETTERVGTLVDSATAKVETLGSETELLLSDARQVMNMSKEMLDGLKGFIVNTGNIADDLMITMKNQIAHMCGGKLSFLIDCVSDIALCVIMKSWIPLASGLVKLVIKITGLAHGVILEFIKPVIDTIEHLWHAGNRTEDVEDTNKIIISSIVSIIGVLTRVQLKKKTEDNFFRETILSFTSGSTTGWITHVFNFVTKYFDCFKEYLMEAIGYVSPQMSAARMLGKHSKDLERFIQDAQIVTNEANKSRLKDPYYKRMVWLTNLQALQIQKILSTAPKNVASPVLSNICAGVIKYANENFLTLAACPVRYEPYVYCIEGPSGIGKSFLNRSFVKELMESIDRKPTPSGLIYVRQPGSKFFNGFKDQLNITYDDWGAITTPELLSTTFHELFQLKTAAEYIPEKASLEEKEGYANPLTVGLLTNKAFPTQASSVCGTYQALYRRRDILIRAEMKPEYGDSRPRDLPSEITEQYGHLRFRIHNDPGDEEAGYDMRWYTWTEMLDYVKPLHKRYHEAEVRQVEKRMREEVALFRNARPEDVDLSDPFALFYSSIVRDTIRLEEQDVEMIPSTILEREVLATVEMLNPFLIKVRTEAFIEETIEESINGLLDLTPDLNLLFGETECYGCKQTFKLEECCLHTHRHCSACIEKKKNTCACSSGKYIGITQIANRLKKLQEVGPRTALKYYARAHNLSRNNLIKLLQTLRGIRVKLMGRERDMMVHATQEEKLEAMFTTMVPDPIVVERLCKNYKGSKVCLHQELINMGENAFWKDDTWVIPMGSARQGYREVDIEPNACCSSCPFADFDTHYKFLSNWAQLNHESVTRNRDLAHNIRKNPHPESWIKEIHPALRTLYLEDDKGLIGEWWEYMTGQWEKYGKMILTCVAIVAAISGLVHGLSSISTLFGYRKQLPHTEMYSTGDIVPKHNRPYREIHARRITTKALQNNASKYNGRLPRSEGGPAGDQRVIKPLVEMGEDKALNELVQQRILQNQVVLTIWNKGVDRDSIDRTLPLQGICGKTAILPKHYFAYIEMAGDPSRGQYMTLDPAYWRQSITDNTRSRIYNFSYSDFTVISDMDIVSMELPNSMPFFKDIKRFFWKEEDLNKPQGHEGLLVKAAVGIQQIAMSTTVEFLGFEERLEVQDQYGSIVESVDLLKYNRSEPGACGSLFLLTGNRRPISGMHVAGNASYQVGFAAILTQEILNDLIQHPNVVEMEDVPLTIGEEGDYPTIHLPEETNVKIIGSVSQTERPHVPNRSGIVKSMIHGAEYDKEGNRFPVYTEPCILSRKDERYKHERSPLEYGCMKHGILTRDFSTDQLIRARDAYYDLCIRKMKPCIVKPRRLTYEEAVVGIPDKEFYEALKLNTSSGYPWSKMEKDTTKNPWITGERDDTQRLIDCKLHPDLIAELVRKENLRRQGIVPLTIFTDTLKDERKRPEKARKEGGTRVFCASPLDYTIATRQNLLHFCAAFMKARFDVFSAVGINPKGVEWTDLFNHLTQNGLNNVVEMDYSNFGPGFNAGLAQMARDIFVKWTMENVEGVDQKELEVLLTECTNSVHIADGLVYQQFSGSPSGAAITTVINSIVNVLYILIAWEGLCKTEAMKYSVDIYKIFKEQVRLIVYGDDLIMTVGEKFRNFFNMVTIHDYLEKYGVASTTANKEGKSKEHFISIWQAQFLKRGFLKHPRRRNLYLGPLNKESINDIAQWNWKAPNKKEATEQNVGAALLEAHGHGIEYFNIMKERWNYALSKRNLNPLSLNWEDVDEKWFKGELTFELAHTDEEKYLLREHGDVKKHFLNVF